MSDFGKIAGPGAGMGTALLTEARLKEAQRQADEIKSSRAEGAEKLSPAEVKKMESAAAQFEGILLQQLFKTMWSTVPQNGMLSNSKEEKFYRDMLNEFLADEVSSTQSIGVKDVVLRELRARAGTEE